jgi:uncharacterized membrane protein YdjX (TVP38/TMEM64 family)
VSRGRLIFLLLLGLLIAGFFALGLQRYLTLEYLKAQQAAIADLYQAHPLTVVAAYFGVYVVVTALSLPGAALLTLLGGAVFSSIGATLAFLSSRFLFRDAVQRKFGDKLSALNAGVEREGAFYLFTLRLVPLFPFFVINLAMALTPIRTRTFYWVSQVGMLLGTIAYVNAGAQLAQIESARGILSPTLLISFALLGVLPLLAKKMIDFVRARRGYAK